MMKTIWCSLLLAGALSAQPKVSGRLVELAGEDASFVARNTKVVLISKSVRDTVSLDENLAFAFPKAETGTAYLYLVSPVVPRNVDYKFRVKKNGPVAIELQYDRFRHPVQVVEKTPEQRQDELMTGLFIARIAIDLIFVLRHLH